MISDDEPLEHGMDLERGGRAAIPAASKRVDVRKRFDGRKIASLKLPMLALTSLIVLGGVAWGVTRFATTGAVFTLQEDNIEIQAQPTWRARKCS